ncbi:MAG TPA: SusD/RagB family nutrient-binding outer membrane lipoprotein [Bacteroidales bacterium]|nr:SusD/RagB family nutrient-binding outer membrane lipoprotein [Bacteroidales bacterium]
MKKLIIILTALLVLGSSCKDFLNVNVTNPNSASAVPVDLVLPAALNSVAFFYDQPDYTSFAPLWFGWWSVSSGYSQPSNLKQYLLINSNYQAFWQLSYETAQNFDYIETHSTDSKMKSFRAIAIIMKAYLFQNLVDLYGNVPYSQALSANSGILKPVYDNQKDIYENLVVRLDTAMNIIAGTSADATEVGSSDVIYNGDMGLWAKFANTIKLRILINQSDMSGRNSYITTNLAATASVGYIGAGEGAMLNPGYIQSAGKMNPFWEKFYKQDNSGQADALTYYVAGQDACDFMNTNNDPRASRFFVPTSGGAIAGNYFGAAVLSNPTLCSKLGPGLLQAYNQSAPIFTDVESLFLQAEAVSRGLLTGDAQALYESAVTQSILYEGTKSHWDASSYTPLTSSAAAAYLAQGLTNVGWAASSDKVKAIITQKWIGLMGLAPLSMYTDYRRTGFPDFLHFTADPLRKGPGTPPVRLLYPQTEISTNNDNVVLQGTIDLFTSKIFWQNR